MLAFLLFLIAPAQAADCSKANSLGVGSGSETCNLSAANDSHVVFMKGLELYCWRESGAWIFSLVPGKNAEPAKTEILGSKMRGSHGLKRRLRELPEGTTVTLNPHPINGLNLSPPPQNILNDLKRVCRERKLELQGGV